MPGSSACVSAIGARRLTARARSISCDRERVECSGGRQRRVGDHDVDVAGLGDETVDLAGLDQVDSQRACTELLRQWLEYVGAAAGEDQVAAVGGNGACDRVTDATGCACEKNVRPRDLHRCKPTQMRLVRRARSGPPLSVAHQAAILRAMSSGAATANGDTARKRAEVIALFGPTGVGKTAIAVALAQRLRERGEDARRGLCRCAAGIRRPGDAHGRRLRGRACGAGSPPAVVSAARRDVQRRRVRKARTWRDRRAARRGTHDRSSLAGPGCTCARRSPTSTCVPRRRAARASA